MVFDRVLRAAGTGGFSEIPGLAGGFPNPFQRGSRGSAQPTLADLDLSNFRSILDRFNPQFFDADFGGQRLTGIADVLEQRGRGIAPRDPAFERFRESQFDVFESGAEQQRARAASDLARRGLGGSSTALNQLSGIDERLGRQRSALDAQLGLQELQRQDQSLLQSAGVLGQAGAAEQARLGSVTAGLENLLAIPSLQVSQQAAELAGRIPQERQPGFLGNIFGGLF